MPEDFFDRSEPRLVCTAEMVRSEHRRAVLQASPLGEDGAAPRWYDGVLAEAARMEPIQLRRGSYWSLDAPRLQGRVPHRAVFEGALASIYGRLLDDYA